MPRPQMPLTFDDLRLLAQIVGLRPRSVAAAVKALKRPSPDDAPYNAPGIRRLLDRVEEFVGRPALDWSHGRTPRVPPPVMRMLDAFEIFESSLASPRVAAGPSAAVLLGRVLADLSRTLPRAAFVRSNNALAALLRGDIDLAIIHASSVERLREGGPWSVAQRVLVEWQPIRVTRRDGPPKSCPAVLRWQAGSLGHRLAARHTSTATPGTLGWQVDGFLAALDLVRNGIVPDAVVPDIYLPRHAHDLVAVPVIDPDTDALVGLFRRDEEAEWNWLLDPSRWQALRTG